MTETQQRFLRAIAERVPTEQVVEIHLFPPIRQGGVETGVAVVAEDPRRAAAPVALDAVGVVDAPSVEPMGASVESGDAAISIADADSEPMQESADDNGAETPLPRLTIHTARYRLTLKGVDRGKWEVDVVAEADAPLEAVDKVVRGVQRRSGEGGAEPDRLTADAFREALEAPLAQLER